MTTMSTTTTLPPVPVPAGVQRTTTARAAAFYLPALGGCAALAVAVPDGQGAAVLAMLTPTVAVLLVLAATRSGARCSNRQGAIWA